MGFALALSACGGGGDGDGGGASGTQQTQSGIGAAGGTVVGPNGSKVEIPSGALAAVTQIAVDQTSANAPPLPAGLTPIGQMFAFTPHGTTFAVPVTITMPFDPGAVPAGRTPALFKTNAQNQWVEVANPAFGADNVSAQVSSFSFAQVVTEDDELERTNFIRTFIFSEIQNVGTSSILGGQKAVEVETIGDPKGDAVRVHDFGPADFDQTLALLDGSELVRNGIASGVVASKADGKSFQVAAEAPRGNAEIDGDTIGGAAKFIQEQTFIKRDENATLTFTMPLARIETHDENAIIGRVCPSDFVICDFIQGALSYEIQAFTADDTLQDSKLFFSIGGNMFVHGFAKHWTSDPSTTLGSQLPFWFNTDFEFKIEDIDGTEQSKATLTLVKPHTFSVDLSSVKVGDKFHLHVQAEASAFNRFAGPPSELPTAAGAYMNFEDPSGDGGAIFTSTGLEEVETPTDLTPPPLIIPPASCVPGAGAPGTLQFSQSSYTTRETDEPPSIKVTRTGGTSGAVTALFSTSDGTATEGTDYDGVTATVFFADGDAEPRTVAIPITEDNLTEANETVKLTLSQPGGCGTLGTQDTATLTIVDDDAQPQPSGLDASFGDGGKASIKHFGGARSGMAVQPDGKVIMVGGTFADFVMARFNADGTVDNAFGPSGNGTVTTHIAGADPVAQESASAVTVQRDGKIVVAGNATVPGSGGKLAIALVRYNSNGTVDTSFNGNGFVFGPTLIFGRAFAVAIDAQDRIVVAGDTPKQADPDFGDFVVARFRSNGTLDPTFGQGGFNITDIGGVTNEAHSIKVLDDHKLLVSGFAPITITNVNGVDIVSPTLGSVVRYLDNGFPDPTFGPDGRVALPGDNVGRGLAVQSDGEIVLAGSVNVGTPTAPLNRFAVMRLLADGRIDTSFGDGGRVQTQFSDRGDDAFGVAVQADGKIVAAGRSSSQLNSNFAVARYDTKGNLDPSFNVDGKLTVDFFGSTDIAENIVIQSNGKIVLGGIARDIFDGYGVARVLP
ncbi:MAG TPA: Calx-beta domain-containing protein [Steroidobacteraceae bacterium]